MKSYKKLEAIFREVAGVEHTRNLLSWDEATMMPEKGGEFRAESIAVLKNLERKLVATEENAKLVEGALLDPSLNCWQKKNLLLMHKKIRIEQSMPEDLIKKMTACCVRSEQKWRVCRENNDWKSYVPVLQEVLEYVREYACILGDLLSLNQYDALIDLYSPGMRQGIIDPIFDQLKAALPKLIETIEERQRPVIIPQGVFDVDLQKEICLELMRSIGFDFERGRLDTSCHPFCGPDPDDVRITARYSADSFISALLGACHEAGHAMYQFALPKEWNRQPVGQPLGMTVHESQSLIVEMHACRSLEFCCFLSPILVDKFGSQPSFEPNDLYRLLTRVERSLIRVDADEVTYPFHVILRYEIEKGLLSGELEVQDLPEVWNAKMEDYLGINPGNDYANGVMQDVHWPSGTFGYFPAYNLGSLTAAQLFACARNSFPGMMQGLEKGDFSLLNHWLDENIRSKGSLYDFSELLQHATGENLNPTYYLDHVRERYVGI